jgi:uncharacterized protein (DUF2235 family)
VLYAFDGTGNKDKPGTDRDTNVVLFRDAYTGQKLYYKGIGTRFGIFGAAIGSMTGLGGRSRADEAYEEFERFIAAGDAEIDIVGFSRGAALALHFANKVARHPSKPSIRFLGLWDCVPSFGIASLRWNIGWDLDLPATVQHCFHALSLDERRQTFRLYRPKIATNAARHCLCEIWFAGVHSDVGGGNTNAGLSSIALNWMFRKALSCGLPIDPGAVARNAAHMQPGCASSDAPPYDVIKNPFRRVPPGDQIHSSVGFRTDGKRCNNPPIDCPLVDDEGHEVGRFRHDAV